MTVLLGHHPTRGGRLFCSIHRPCRVDRTTQVESTQAAHACAFRCAMAATFVLFVLRVMGVLKFLLSGADHSVRPAIARSTRVVSCRCHYCHGSSYHSRACTLGALMASALPIRAPLSELVSQALGLASIAPRERVRCSGMHRSHSGCYPRANLRDKPCSCRWRSPELIAALRCSRHRTGWCSLHSMFGPRPLRLRSPVDMLSFPTVFYRLMCHPFR